MGYLKSAGTVFIYIGLFLALVTFLPGIPPDAQFSEYSIVKPKSGFTDNPKVNRRLNDPEILFKGEINSPESFASYNGELYTTLHGGDVVKIVGKHIVPIVKFGEPCDGIWMEKECGRPLGLQFDKNGVLYVVDTYKGIFKVDVTSGKYERIIDLSKPIEGLVPKFANDLDIASNGDIYWSDSSSEFPLYDGVYACLANPSGRLIKYDAATKRNIVLVNNLGLANGVQLSKDESFVVVAETITSRLTKFNLKGNKAGRAEPFIEGLPGLPDNIHSDHENGFLVSFVVTLDPERPIITQSLTPHPNIRKMAVRLGYLLEAPFKLIEDIYPNYYSKRVVHWLGHFESAQSIQPGGAGILRIDATGNIIDAAFNSDDKIEGISSAYIFKDYVYLGSPYNDYLARVPLSQAFPSMKIKTEKIVSEKVIEKREVKEEVKPVKQSPPTTTTPPPTTTTTQKPKPVTTTPKPVSTTTQKPATAAPTTTRPPPQQQQEKQQQAPKLSKEASPKPASQAPTTTSPPPPPPAKEVPVKEAVPSQQAGQKQAAKPEQPSKPASKEQTVKNVKKTEDAKTVPQKNPGNGQKPPPPSKVQKPSKPEAAPVPVAGKNAKEAEPKKQEEKIKPPVTNPPPPRN